MMQATSSPERITARSSAMAQRLQEAAALDSHLNEIERAREALEQAKGRKPPPPPPPSSPRSRALTRVMELAKAELHSNAQLSLNSASVALETLQSVIDQVLQEHVPSTDESIGEESADDGGHVNGSGDYKRLLPFEDEMQQFAVVPRRSLPQNGNDDKLALVRSGGYELQSQAPAFVPGRFWRATIGSATLRHGRVEYEIRSAHTSVAVDDSLEVTTGTSFVRRRYRDFDRLYSALSKVLNHSDFVLIPNLPPKDVTSIVSGNRADPDFVWSRRLGLQLWLRFVCDHHVIRNSTLLREFLWEPASAAVSNDSNQLETVMNPAAETLLWDRAIKHQIHMMERRFGNSVVALMSMKTHIRTMIHAYHKASSKADAVLKADASLTRSLQRAANVLNEWAEFERSAGQNYGFVSKFADSLPATDIKRPSLATPSSSGAASGGTSSSFPHPSSNAPFFASSAGTHNGGVGSSSSSAAAVAVEPDALVSFAEKNLQLVPANSTFGPHSVGGGAAGHSGGSNAPRGRGVSHRNSQELLRKECIEDPVLPGAACEVRSMRAIQLTLQLWGDVVLPKLENNLVDPRQTSPLYSNTSKSTSTNEGDSKKKSSSPQSVGTRVACEWTELENLKCAMVRDSAIWMVEEQIRKAREEIDRWTVLRESIKAQEAEISSLVAIGEVMMGGTDAPSLLFRSPSSGNNGSVGSGGMAAGSTNNVPTVIGATGMNIAGGVESTTGGNRGKSNDDHHHHHHHRSLHPISGTSSSSSSTASSPIEHRLSSRLQQQPPQSSSSKSSQVLSNDQDHHKAERNAAMIFDERILDANLDAVQARYREEHESDGIGGMKEGEELDSVTMRLNVPNPDAISSASKFHDPDSSRYLNPFFSDEDD